MASLAGEVAARKAAAARVADRVLNEARRHGEFESGYRRSGIAIGERPAFPLGAAQRELAGDLTSTSPCRC